MPTLTYRFSRQFLRCAFGLTGGLEVHGQEHVPVDGPLIVACNHASHLDPMILGAAFRRDLHFMARRTLFDVPGFNWLIRHNQAFPLDRDGDSREALRAFGERLEKGYAVVMFPEGTRTLDGTLQEFKPGLGMLAVRNAAPVLPVYIWGSFQGWPRGKRFPRPHHLKVYMGDVVVPSGDKAVRKQEQRRITDEVTQAFRSLEGQAWEGENPPPALLASWAARPGRDE
ncbi:MAG: 1-acyl-sn-glycerol-3-phosphate acyltransferase [Planctomycetes bacterium]|nr:1-acyl-sn-glycerol-3-phosphate acyltransferase [Planctomycetota bacterium]